MILPKPEELQAYIDGLMTAHKNYVQVAIRYIGRDESVYENMLKDAKMIGSVCGWMTYLKKSVEAENEMVD